MWARRRRVPIVVCVVEQNRLAAEFLLQLLSKGPAISPILLEDLPKQHTGQSADPLLFLLDNWTLCPPLSECLRRLRSRYPNSAYLVLDKHQPDENIVRMLWFGIHGFLEHREVAQSVVSAVHAISEGQMWVTNEVLQAYVRSTASAGRYRSLRPELTTPRETQIIELVKRRLSNREIAAILNIQENTVKFHLSNIFTKLGVTKRHDLQPKEEIPGNWAEVLG